MQEEAAQGRQRTCQDRNNLTPQTRADPQVTAPYSSAMITETARHREVISIYHYASLESRAIYDRGVMQDGSNWDNWIIRWCLWHVFRYRDDRNRNRSGNRNSRDDLQFNGGKCWPTVGVAQRRGYVNVSRRDCSFTDGSVVKEPPQGGYYDPVYDVRRN